MVRRTLEMSVALAVVAAAAAGCAQGQGRVSHGPVYNDSGAPSGEGGQADAGQDADASMDAPVTGDAMAVDSAPVDAQRTEASVEASAPVDSASPEDVGQPVDSTSPPLDSASPLGDGAACSSTIAVVAGGAAAAYGATSHTGTWTVGSLQGSASSVPALVAMSGGFQAVFEEATTNVLGYSIFTSAWSALAPIGAALTLGQPSLATVGTDVHVVYQGTDSKFYHGIYASGAWNAASDPVSSGGVQSFGPSPPSAASAEMDLVIVQDGSNNYLYDQTWSGSWQPAVEHAAAMVGTVAPTLAAPNGGTYDLFTIFVHETDFMLYWSGRSNGTWSTPALVNSNAYTSYPVALAPLPNGQFVLVYEGGNQEPYFTLFSPTASTPWTAPALLVASGPTVSAPPAVAPGVCGYDALAVYVDVGGAEVVGLTGTTWSSPSTIPGTTAATYAAIATSP